MIVLLMGVAGSGKTTVGRLLAQELGWSFADADDFHSAAAIAKMSAGQALTDADRAPWLERLRAYIDGCLARGENAVLACSALKQRYRDALTGGRSEVRIVHLHGSPALIQHRLAQRQGHFMRAHMAASQFATLELPAKAIEVDVTPPPAEIVAQIRRALRV